MKTNGWPSVLDFAVALPVACGWSALTMISYHSNEALEFKILPSGASTLVGGPMLLILVTIFGTLLAKVMYRASRPRLLNSALFLQLLSTVLGALMFSSVSRELTPSGFVFIVGSGVAAIAGLAYWAKIIEAKPPAKVE